MLLSFKTAWWQHCLFKSMYTKTSKAFGTKKCPFGTVLNCIPTRVHSLARRHLLELVLKLQGAVQIAHPHSTPNPPTAISSLSDLALTSKGSMSM